MQELTITRCRKAIVGDTKQLIDIRDKTKYWVAKLPDENCWMTQNLDYNDPSSIRRGNSDIISGWSATIADRQYWDPGKKIAQENTLADAPDDVDEHLLVGNYYSYMSATNGTAPSTTGTALDSICPNGWQLPTSGNTDNGSFGWLQLAGSIDQNGDILNSSPFYFQYSGYVHSNALHGASVSGSYWSSTAYNNNIAYDLGFYASTVNPSDVNGTRYVGMSVRCLVLGS